MLYTLNKESNSPGRDGAVRPESRLKKKKIVLFLRYLYKHFFYYYNIISSLSSYFTITRHSVMNDFAFAWELDLRSAIAIEYLTCRFLIIYYY